MSIQTRRIQNPYERADVTLSNNLRYTKPTVTLTRESFDVWTVVVMTRVAGTKYGHEVERVRMNGVDFSIPVGESLKFRAASVVIGVPQAELRIGEVAEVNL